MLGGTDGGEDAHEAKVGKEPREEDGEAQEGAKLGKELQVAGKQRQRCLRNRARPRAESVSGRRVPSLPRLPPGRRASRKGWRLTKIDVHMPLKTGEPISEKVFMRRSSLEP